MPDKSSNVPSSIVYSAIDAESLRIARASNRPTNNNACYRYADKTVMPVSCKYMKNKNK